MNRKRETLKRMSSLGLVAYVLPSSWSAPLIKNVVLPAHAMTSDAMGCSAFDIEPVDEPISITVTDTEVRGPVVASRMGSVFSVSENITLNNCGDDLEMIDQTIDFRGSLSAASNQIEGDFLIRQFCGTELVCEQIATFMATQIQANPNSALGEYSGRVTGTLRCCVDFL